MNQIYYNIIDELQKNPNHQRGIAKALKTNPSTIARKLKELEHQNILDHKTQGKNKTYYLKDTMEAREATISKEHNKLIQTIKKHPRLRAPIEKIKNNSNIQLAILFGSYAKGSQTKESDIDIYIETTDNSIKKELEETDTKLSVKTGKFDKNNPLLQEIIKSNVIIKGAERYHELIHQ